MEQTDRPTQSKNLKRNKKKKEKKKKNIFTTKASSLYQNTHSPLNLAGPSLYPPGCPVLAVRRLIIHLYLNTHKAYTGKEPPHRKNKIIQSRER